MGKFSEVQPSVLLLAVAGQNQLDVWQRSSEDNQGELRLLAMGQLPPELSGKWSADFAERYEAAWERYEAACS